MSKVKFCLFASTPDMLQLDFVVKVLTGTPEELGRTAMSWRYDGIRAAKGLARHIHLYEPSRLPPGVSTEKEALDWPNIARILSEEGFEGSASAVIVPKGDPEPIAENR